MKKNVLALAVIASLTLSACGGGSSSSSDDEVVSVVETVATSISLDNITVDENTAGAVIGNLSAIGGTTSESLTFTTDNDLLEINGTVLSLKSDETANYEQAETITASITVTTTSNLTFTQPITIEVNDLLDTYKFESQFTDGASSVNYSGQTARLALIAELNTYIGASADQAGLEADVNAGTIDGETITEAVVVAKLNSYFRVNGDLPLTFLAGSEQTTIREVNSTDRTLEGKLAGNDDARLNINWNEAGNFVGATPGLTPTELVDSYFLQLAQNAVNDASGSLRTDAATGQTISQVYINANGTDLKQLIQKFLLMGVTYSQGTDDYLDEGLDSDNIVARNDSNTDTALEHGYDEGFGYFGANRNFLEYADALNRDTSNDEFDVDGNGTFDLLSEVNLGNATNAARRDLGSANNANPTDFTTDAMTAFIAGREIINTSVGRVFTTEERAELEAQRDIAVGAWENAIAATVVHYINDLTENLNEPTETYSFEDVAKHFSEMKGFALGLQFNPHSAITTEQFAQLHTYFGQAPVTPTLGSDDRTAVDAYLADLQLARDLLQEVLAFDADNVEGW